MTIRPSSNPPISAGDVNSEMGNAYTYSSDLVFLNNNILASQRPSTPNLGAFYGLTWLQNLNNGNCNNGNVSINNCNCGQCNCNPVNCDPVNCANCDTRPWLQSATNCTACTYNCSTHNCYTQGSNCSKIICAKLYEQGHMAPSIWAADQKYGRYLRRTDKRVYQGYIKWARIVTSWMDGKGPVFMPWIKDEATRNVKQKAAITDMALKIGTPWSEHMAYLMGTLKQDNIMGRILMNIGRPICRLISYLPHVGTAKRRHSLPVVWTMWTLFYFSYFTASGCTKLLKLIETVKNMKQVKDY